MRFLSLVFLSFISYSSISYANVLSDTICLFANCPGRLVHNDKINYEYSDCKLSQSDKEFLTNKSQAVIDALECENKEFYYTGAFLFDSLKNSFKPLTSSELEMKELELGQSMIKSERNTPVKLLDTQSVWSDKKSDNQNNNAINLSNEKNITSFDKLETLKELDSLLTNKLISQEEFEKLKADLFK